MNEARKPTSAVLMPAIVALVLLGLYSVSYYVMVRPIGESVTPRIPTYHSFGKPGFRRFVGTGWNAFYAPIHRLDRRIRSRVWEPTR